MSIDTIVYEKHNSAATLALMEDGNLLELIFANENAAAEGNIYLGRITQIGRAHV